MTAKNAKWLSAFQVLIMLVVAALSGLAVTSASTRPVLEPATKGDATPATATVPALFSPPHSDYGLDLDSDGPFDPPHSDHGVDENNDSLYDSLIVDVSLQSTTNLGYCDFSATLRDGNGSAITSTEFYYYLSAGSHILSIRFPGPAIRAHGVDGPFSCDMVLRCYNPSPIRRTYQDIYTTSMYFWEEFSGPSAQFSPPYSDFGLDNNGDTLYELLVVQVSVDVGIADWYTIGGTISGYSEGWYREIGRYINRTYLEVGLQTVELQYFGVRISARHFDGQFTVSLDLHNDWGTLIETDSHETSAYLSENFARYPASLTGGTHDYRLDLDMDGLWDYLYVEVHVLVIGAGFYKVEGNLRDLTSPHEIIASIENLTYLEAGLQTVNLVFPGSLIRSYLDNIGFDQRVYDGMFQVVLRLYINDDSVPVECRFLFTSWDYTGTYNPIPVTAATLAGTKGLDDCYVSSVDVTLTASGVQGGTDYTMYRIDGGSWLVYGVPFEVVADGAHMVEFYSVNNTVNKESTKNVSFKIDATAPTTAYAMSGTEGLLGWHTSAITVTLTAVDGGEGSGVDEIQYRIGPVSWQMYSGPISVSFDGTAIIEYRSVDCAGNHEETRSLSIKIDSEAPFTTASVENGTVTLTAADATSGTERIEFRIDGGTWQTYAATFEVIGEGNHTVEYFSIDNAGNPEAVKTVWVEIIGARAHGGDGALVLVAAAIVVATAIVLYFIKWRKNKPD